MTNGSPTNLDTLQVEYLYDEEGAPWGGVYRSPASSTSPTYFNIVTNDRGDVLELCDADGAAFASYRYDAWGSPLSSSTQATTLITATLAGEITSRQILRYASYAFDAESGFYYCSARYYDPATRQWTTGDPAKADGEESAYQYCGGDPVGRVDPTGMVNKTTKRAYTYHDASGADQIKVRGILYWQTNGRNIFDVSTDYDRWGKSYGLIRWKVYAPSVTTAFQKAGGYSHGKLVAIYRFDCEHQVYVVSTWVTIYEFTAKVTITAWANTRYSPVGSIAPVYVDDMVAHGGWD